MSATVCRMFVIAFAIAAATLPLSSCAMSEKERALKKLAETAKAAGAFSDWGSATRAAKTALRGMQAETYFSDAIQADFVGAIGHGELERAQRLLEQGADVNAVGKEGMTTIYWAILKQNLESLRFVLARGANPNTLTRWVGASGREELNSALQLASMLEDSRYLRALLDAGGDANLIINEAQHTPIFHALLHDRFGNASLLIERGANINHRTKFLATPIHRAVLGAAYASALFLLRAGANPEIKDNIGDSAVDITRQFGKAGVVIGSADDAAYSEFVAELKRRGLWGDEP